MIYKLAIIELSEELNYLIEDLQDQIAEFRKTDSETFNWDNFERSNELRRILKDMFLKLLAKVKETDSYEFRFQSNKYRGHGFNILKNPEFQISTRFLDIDIIRLEAKEQCEENFVDIYLNLVPDDL